MIVDVVLFASLALYLGCSILLFVFGVNLIRFSMLALRHRRRGLADPEDEGPLPSVTVQLPVYNELYVAARLIDAVSRLDYPQHLLQIQVLDDSDDETVGVVAEAVAAVAARGIDIEHVRRADRQGFKAGALAAGLTTATGSLVAIFDADFVPPSDFLLRTVGSFADPELAFVQARWGHLNGRFSWLTRLQVPAIDAHFLVEQRARGLGHHWFNFNGTAGIWRIAAIADAGGWQNDTLTEDLDLSYRAHLRGWHGRYLSDLLVPGELPADLAGFRRQQHRWARGSLECAVKLLAPIWRSPQIGIGTKFQATAHLLAYSVHILLLIVMLTYPAVVLATDRLPITESWYGAGIMLSLAALAPAVFLISGQVISHQQDPGRVFGRLPVIGAMILFGSGLMVNTTRAALEILYRPDPAFERTAKFGLDTGHAAPSGWSDNRYRGRLDRIVCFELAIGCYGWAGALFAASRGSWGIASYSAFFGTGILTVAFASLGQELKRRRPRQRRSTLSPNTSGSSTSLASSR